MRQHVVLNCENLPDAEKQRVQAIQNQKDAASEQKKINKRSASNADALDAGSGLGADTSAAADINGAFGDMFSRLSGAHPGSSGVGDGSFFSYSALSGTGGGGGHDASNGTSGGNSGLPGSGPTGGVDKQGNSSAVYKTGSSSSKKKRKKEESSTAGSVGSNWHLSSFLNLP